MAATGGGKIRSRRYHIATKPYAKNKQQQSGLISRVTDTVKSIVPSWLQKYFKNEDGPEGGGTEEGRDQNCQLSPSPPQPPNGNEEAPPVDGRDSPEPSTSNTEPTTSRASLNFQECVLSRPPLNRSHLHLTPLDAASPSLGPSNSLFSPPSTSSAPGPFTTGFSLIKEIKDNLSQHEDDNISTTSGFSSRASDKDVPTSKTASLPQLWSPEMDRSHTGPQPSQSSLKRPSFNLSVFGTSSNTSFNNTVLNSSQLGDSSFYPGKTTYGGAAAARSSRNRPGTPYQPPVRRQIKAKPAGVQPCGVTSATARRILQSLERMSSPLADARRIPASASSPLSTTLDSMIPDVPRSQAKKKRMDTNLPPVQKLLVPSVAATARNRSMSFRPTLTPGGGGRPLDKAPAETPTRQSPQLPEMSPRPSQSTMGYSAPAYPLSSTPAANSVTFGGGKMKRERSSARVSMKRHEEDGQPELPDLPTVSLPISTSALPTFSFTSPLPASAIGNSSSITVTPVKEVLTMMETPAASSSPSVPFTFSSPIVKAAPASTPISPSAGFTFSAPVAKGPSMSNGKLASSKVAAVKSAPCKSTVESDGLFKPAKTLKQGSVLDLLKTPGFTSAVQTGPCPDDAPQQTTASPPPTTAITTTSALSSSAGFGDLFKPPPGWTCDACLVQNKPSDKKCVCCMTPQPNSSSSTQLDNKPSTATSVGLESSSTTSTTTAGFAAVFAKPVGTWDCDTCLVRNKADAVKCVACETAKPGTGLKTSLTIPSAFSAIKAEAAPAPPVSTGFAGFGDKFKKAEGAWECDTCMVENKAEATKCVACMNTKPGATTEAAAGASTPASSAPVLGFGEAFKKPEGSWDCDVCLVQNKAADVECVACQTPKPGAQVDPKGKTGGASSSSTFGSSTSNSGGFKFGTTEIITGSASEGFKFGGSFGDSSAAPTGFKFGVPFGSASSETASQDGAASSGFKFAGSSEGFKFGTASSDDKTSEPAAASGFKFGNSGGIVFGTGSSNAEIKSGFSFGATKPDDKPPHATASSTGAAPAAAAPQEKSDGVTTNDSVSDANSTAPTTTTTTTAATKASVFARLGESPAAPAPQASSVFGSLPTKEPAAPTFTFGKPEEKEAAQSPAPSGFVFGGANKDVNAAPAPAAKGGFTFGKPSAPAEQPPPVFSFGKAADTSETPATEPPKAAFTFGQSAPDSSTAPKPAFSFVFGNPTNSVAATTTAAAAAAAAASSSSITTPSLFGSSTASSQAPAPSAASSTFVFGQTATSSGDGPPAKSAFVFGKSQDSQPSAPSAAPPNSTAAPAPAPAQPFMFGASANAAAAPPAAAPAFGFGAVAPSVTSSSAPSAASSPFTFSSAPSGGFGASQAPSFGSFGSPFTAPPSQSPPTFGANPNPNPTPVFGQQANSTPAFGANANSSAGGGFQFGASGFGATNNTSGVFTFGAGAAASPAPPANPAIPPQTGAAGPGFNFAQAPSFNIGSTKSFTAPPAGQQAIAGRKFKMAVRRRK